MLQALLDYAAAIRRTRPSATNLEQALAPHFHALLQAAIAHAAPAAGLDAIAEYATPGIGRPDFALKRAGQPARAFIELKSPDKPADPAAYTLAHDKKQFEAFKSLPV